MITADFRKRIRAQFGTRDVMLQLQSYFMGDVLDFGCGSGKQKALILQHARSYTGMDIEPGSAVSVVGDVHNAPLPGASFDTIISNQVIEHVEKPWVMVQEMHRLLRPGGKVIITAPFLVPFHANPTDFYRYTTSGLAALCEHAGLHVELCEPHGGIAAVFFEFVKQKYVSPLQKRSLLRRLLIQQLDTVCRWVDRMLPPGIVYCSVVCIARKP